MWRATGRGRFTLPTVLPLTGLALPGGKLRRAAQEAPQPRIPRVAPFTLCQAMTRQPRIGNDCDSCPGLTRIGAMYVDAQQPDDLKHRVRLTYSSKICGAQRNAMLQTPQCTPSTAALQDRCPGERCRLAVTGCLRRSDGRCSAAVPMGRWPQHVALPTQRGGLGPAGTAPQSMILMFYLLQYAAEAEPLAP
jgi:hypothetical protein